MADPERKASRRPPDNAFQQQRLAAWQPLLTPFWVISTFTVVGILFVVLGLIIRKASMEVVELEARYDECQRDSNDRCTLQLTVVEDMKAPIFFYYKLTNFYQNHRRYVKSRSDKQLQGITGADTSACDPLQTWNGTQLYPCGLIANSFFNDTFTAEVCGAGGVSCQPLTVGGAWLEDGIAWESDIAEKFRDTDPPTPPSVGPNGQLPNVTDEHFIVWMRTAGLPTFKKLYARLPHTSFKAQDVIKVNLTNVFVVAPFNGQKSVVFTTLSWLGGKNDFLAWAYIVVGILCLVLAIGFYIKHKISPRRLGDMRYFNWPGTSTNK